MMVSSVTGINNNPGCESLFSEVPNKPWGGAGLFHSWPSLIQLGHVGELEIDLCSKPLWIFGFVFLTKRNKKVGQNCREYSLGKDQLPHPRRGATGTSHCYTHPQGFSGLRFSPFMPTMPAPTVKGSWHPCRIQITSPTILLLVPTIFWIKMDRALSCCIRPTVHDQLQHPFPPLFPLRHFASRSYFCPDVQGAFSPLFLGQTPSCFPWPNLSAVPFLDTSPESHCFLLFLLYISTLKCSYEVPHLPWTLS